MVIGVRCATRKLLLQRNANCLVIVNFVKVWLKKMTDNEIIKALECCNGADTDCWKCELFDCCKSTVHEIMQYALDLINRQTADIARLEKIAEATYASAIIAFAQAEAIKEFAERLKYTLIINNEHNNVMFDYDFTLETIDNLVKEMVGDTNDQ